MSIRPAISTLTSPRNHVSDFQDPCKSYEPFNGDKFLNLYKTLAVDTRAEAAPKVIPTENKYAKTTSSSNPVKRFLKAMIKILWSKGGATDKVDGIPRLHSTDIQELLPKLQPGDVIINGNNGGLSHVAMYTGDDQLVHSMATRSTMRGLFGAIWDAIKECFGYGPMNKTGVITEGFGEFLDRFERDTYVVVRREGLTPEQVQKGIERLNNLVGKPYDYDFSGGDDEYYCTELVLEYLDAALEKDNSTVFQTTHHNFGFFKTDGITPENILEHPHLTPIAASKSAAVNFNPWLEDAAEY